jgi:signal transduction histidine kinase
LPAESRRALYPRLFVALIIHGGITATQWGEWSRFAGLWIVFVLYCGASIALARFWDREHLAVVVAKVVASAGLLVIDGHWSSWAFETWLFLPFAALSRDSANFRTLRLSYASVMSISCVVAVIDHAEWLAMATLALMALATYASAERRLRFTCNMMDELARKNAQLQQAHTDLAAMHARAVEQEKLSGLGMLAAGVAHEINNPMAFVTTNLELLLDELHGREQLDAVLKDYSDDVLPATLDGVRRVNAIVGDLRRFSRGDPEGMIEYDINTQVTAALRIMNNKIVHRCELEVALGDVPRAMGMPQQVVQVIINLLDNAVDAHPDDRAGRIAIATSCMAGTIRVVISDRGVGMTPELRAKVFEPFFTSKGIGRGTGLGLSVAYGIIKSHGGTIEIDSVPGQGSTVTVVLPVQPGLSKLASAERTLAA